MIKIKREVEHSQAHGCWLYIQAGYTAIFIGKSDSGPRWRVDVLSKRRKLGIHHFKKK